MLVTFRDLETKNLDQNSLREETVISAHAFRGRLGGQLNPWFWEQVVADCSREHREQRKRPETRPG